MNLNVAVVNIIESFVITQGGKERTCRSTTPFLHLKPEFDTSKNGKIKDKSMNNNSSVEKKFRHYKINSTN